MPPDPFKKIRLQTILQKWYGLFFLVLLSIIPAWLIAKTGILGIGLLLVLPCLFFYVFYLFKDPKIGLFTCVILAFAGNGLTRYVPSVPFGLSIDGILVLTYVAVFFQTKNKANWKLASNMLTWCAVIWFGYNVLELVNPEARSRVAWFYAMRGVALYMLLIIPLTSVLLKKQKDMDMFILLWFICSLAGSLNGIKQQQIGVDRFEQAWLDAGAATQHILFGKLRVFSFYSDAGQFGAAQGHTLVVAGILALGKSSWKRKLFYGITAVLSLYGMMISGTRGALSVPALGFFTYFVLSKNFRIVILGILVGFSIFYVLKFTHIGQGVYAINRMRTALDPNDASFQVRLANQRKLGEYLRSRPLGGGVGSSGNWGLRFSPNTFLAQTPTDSWFVKIWAEEGIIGLTIHLMILLYIAIQGGYYIWYMEDEVWRHKLIAFHAGLIGIYIVSYGNGVLGQMPTGVLLYMSMVFIFQGKSSK